MVNNLIQYNRLTGTPRGIRLTLYPVLYLYSQEFMLHSYVPSFNSQPPFAG